MASVALELGVGALKFVAESFLQQVREQKALIDLVPGEINQLGDDIYFLQQYLESCRTESSSTSSSRNIITRALLKEVRAKIYDAEDAIDSYVMEEAASQSSFPLKSWFTKTVSNSSLGHVAEHVQSACHKVNAIRDKVENHINQTSDNQTKSDPQEDEDEAPKQNKYGPVFKEEEKDLRSRIGQVAEKLEVIVITGMHGIGKTTLAAKMFYDKAIRENFPNPIWVSVSNNSPENIFRSIMSQPKKSDDAAKVLSNQELRQLVADRIQKDQLFIVMDKVQDVEKWEKLKDVFEGGNKKSKVLVTTNDDVVSRYICGHRKPIALEQLNPADSWSLLQWRVKRDNGPGCPVGSETDGEMIADQCGGLPLAIDFVGDTFARSDSVTFDILERKRIWKELATEIDTYFTDDQKKTSILSSYNSLPYDLRACFLYLGIFPRSSTFSASKLTRMWIAEGFVQPGDRGLERNAEIHLKDLVNKKLVICEDKMPDGSLKTCRMNYLFYNFCKKEAGRDKENFFQEFRQSKDRKFNPEIDTVDKTRRFCIHTEISSFMPKFISSRSHEIRVGLHSFVSHDTDKFPLHGKDTSIIRAAFKLLRVLDAKPIQFEKIPTSLCQLVYLRFVTISLNQAVLPEDISKLRNVQTLIVHTKSDTLEMKANILKMVELRHFKTNASTTFLKKSRDSEKAEQLQTLCGISPKSCTQKFFSKTPHLKKLGIRGKLALLLGDKNAELLKILGELKKLNLLNDRTSSKPKVNLSSLIQPTRFPPSLRSLTLFETSLDWEQIYVLGSLQNLEELKLKDNAFVGPTWKWKDMNKAFPSLQTLHLKSLDFAHWESSKDHFPELRRLELVDCTKLENVPFDLAGIKSFQKLHLHKGHASAIESAKKIEDEIIKTHNINFKLLNTPESLTT